MIKVNGTKEYSKKMFHNKINILFFELKVKHSNYSQRDFAEDLGISQPNVQRYLSGSVMPMDPVLIKRVMILSGCDFDELFGFKK